VNSLTFSYCRTLLGIVLSSIGGKSVTTVRYSASPRAFSAKVYVRFYEGKGEYVVSQGRNGARDMEERIADAEAEVARAQAHLAELRRGDASPEPPAASSERDDAAARPDVADVAGAAVRSDASSSPDDIVDAIALQSEAEARGNRGSEAAATVLYEEAPFVPSKDHVAAALLAILLGCFGIHKFYLGYTTAGFITLGITIVGGVFTLGVTGLLVHAGATGRNDYTMLFLAVSLLMAISVIVLVLTVRENKLAAEVAAMETDEEKEAEAEEKKESGKAFGELAPDVRRSLWLILFSVAFWFMGYNAVTSAFTRYMQVQWGYDIKAASLCLMVATVGAVLSYLPVGILSSKFGRKKLIQAGVILLAVCFATAGLFTAFHPAVYVVFALVGVAWAMINVNSYPMVVEISKSGDVGKYTGYYYTFSMAAQIITPILSGLLLEHVGYQTLMPYATVMVAISFVTISLARHGDNKPEPPKSKLEAFDVGDD